MPAYCDKIKDPAKRKRCLQYKGEFAQASPVKGRVRKPARPVRGGGGY